MNLKVRPAGRELEKAEELVQETVKRCQEEMPKDEDLRVGLGWTEEDFILEDMGGTGAEETMGAESIVLKFNSDVDDWKDNLRRTLAHEYAHTVFWENFDSIEYEWRWVLFEAHGMLFAERMYPSTESPWTEKFDDKELEKHWPELKEQLKEESDWGSMWYGSEEWPQWIGYTLSYRIGQKLKENYSLERFIDLSKSDVINAGDQLFGETQ